GVEVQARRAPAERMRIGDPCKVRVNDRRIGTHTDAAIARVARILRTLPQWTSSLGPGVRAMRLVGDAGDISLRAQLQRREGREALAESSMKSTRRVRESRRDGSGGANVVRRSRTPPQSGSPM